MARLILCFNHTLTEEQRESAKRQLAITEFISPPEELQKLWADVPPHVNTLSPRLEPLLTWLDATAESGDYILIQGDFGACYLLVRHAMAKQLIPIYSTTGRQATERHLGDGSVRVEHIFKHVRFRLYGK